MRRWECDDFLAGSGRRGASGALEPHALDGATRRRSGRRRAGMAGALGRGLHHWCKKPIGGGTALGRGGCLGRGKPWIRAVERIAQLHLLSQLVSQSVVPCLPKPLVMVMVLNSACTGPLPRYL